MRIDNIYLSLSARVIINAEALNMAEAVGNVTRHRRIPIVLMSNGSYRIVYAPAVSGEAIAYHYQRLLSTIARKRGLPVTEMDLLGFYPKFSDNTIIENYYREAIDVIKDNDICAIEAKIVSKSVVADIGGFLYTDKLVKRTSRISFGYLVPALDSLADGAAATYPQLHARYTPGARADEQRLYSVETGSAVYGLVAGLSVSDIAELDMCTQEEKGRKKEIKEILEKLSTQKPERIRAALEALAVLIDSMNFGAKTTRFKPHWKVASLVITVSRAPIRFEATPPHSKEYIVSTMERAEQLGNILGTSGIEIKAYAYIDEDGIKLPTRESLQRTSFETAKSHTEALRKAIEGIDAYLRTSN